VRTEERQQLQVIYASSAPLDTTQLRAQPGLGLPQLSSDSAAESAADSPDSSDGADSPDGAGGRPGELSAAGPAQEKRWKAAEARAAKKKKAADAARRKAADELQRSARTALKSAPGRWR
jgi:hypothetical protein